MQGVDWFDLIKNQIQLHMLKLRVRRTLEFRTQHVYKDLKEKPEQSTLLRSFEGTRRCVCQYKLTTRNDIQIFSLLILFL
jgi:hypothetical protein